MARILLTALLTTTALAVSAPEPTSPPLLRRQDANSALVGYITGAADNSRTCDFPQTLSTSGEYVRCCPTSGACPFFTTCASNTLMGDGTSVPCDNDPTLGCNTALVRATADGDGGLSYLACWQTTLGSSAFVIAQTPGTGSGTDSGTEPTGTVTESLTGSNSAAGATITPTDSSVAGQDEEPTDGPTSSADMSEGKAGVVGAASGLSAVLAGGLVFVIQRLL